MTTGGSDFPATEGRLATAVTLDNASEPETVAGPATETGSVAVKAVTVGGDGIYLGWSEDVTPSTGFPLAEGESFSVDLDSSEQALWAVSASAGDELRVIATN